MLIEKVSLREITAYEGYRKISDLGYAILNHKYGIEKLQTIAQKAVAINSKSQQKFLGLNHIRGVQALIPEVAEIVYDQDRLDFLSNIAGVELEPYPIPLATSHINFYEKEKIPISLHTDGAAIVEIIPLEMSGENHGGGTLVYYGNVDEAENLLQQGQSINQEHVKCISHNLGRSVLLQGRMIMHGAEVPINGHRITLVIAMRSREEPWKDDNTIERIAMDDEIDDFITYWIEDSKNRKLPSLKEKMRRRKPW